MHIEIERSGLRGNHPIYIYISKDRKGRSAITSSVFYFLDMSLDQLVLKRVLLLGLPALLLLLVLEELAGYCYSYGLCETDGTNVFQYGKSATFITRVSHIRLISFAIKQTNKYYLGAQKASGRNAQLTETTSSHLA